MKLRPARPVSRPSTGVPASPGLRAWAWLGAGLLAALPALAQNRNVPADAPPPASAPASSPEEAAAQPEPVNNSLLDAPMFYQLLIGEMEAQAGRGGNAFEVILDAARRSKDSVLFQRAIEIAVQGRSGDRALVAVEAWRATLPGSTEAVRTQVQLLVALERLDELAEPLKLLVEQVPPEERSAVIAGVPRFLGGAHDKAAVLGLSETALAPFVNAEGTRTASRTALGRLALAADQSEKALGLMRRANEDDPSAPGPILLALDLMASQPPAEAVVRAYLARPDALAALRLAYVQALDQRQRIGEAVDQLKLALAQQPETSQAWLTLGAYLVELGEPKEAIKALIRFLDSADVKRDAAERAANAGQQAATTPAVGDDDEDHEDRAQRRIDYAYLLLAQANEQLRQYPEALGWLDKVDPDRSDLALVSRRASLMVHQGQLDAARKLVREAPVRGTLEPRTRVLAESQLLQEGNRWQASYDLLLGAVRAAPEDSVLIYELAMTAEHLKRYDDMEALLRRVITIKPDDAHAYNALGYSLAERNVRLDEAQTLVDKAASLAPDDPFITDSLGWVAFRRGDTASALRLLRQAYNARPHVEVAAHLGEVLWAAGQRDEATRVWREGRSRNGSDNEVLRDTLQRLKASL
ncbi:tetratricopeptide repeat protein [Ideonella azotifigens]|uniref:Tetratricopeptide repeat protein n=1 Tax=Ideonella azotifigens TaxID=513160 RepID=A0ABN1K612_9BURK|nr:tetratricopeptide repeat protein [Ideonella azotifigens]MCD2342489.1 tetratricopeptide repeat protein [Ideonella azotifigens]